MLNTPKCEYLKKAEHQRTDVFKLWCWRRFLRVPWTARRSNQSILKEINPEYSLEGLMLKCQYFDHLMQRANSLEKILMLGMIEGRRKRGWQRMRWLDGITNSMDMWANSRRQWKTGKPGVLLSMRSQKVRHDLGTEQQNVFKHKDTLKEAENPEEYSNKSTKLLW